MSADEKQDDRAGDSQPVDGGFPNTRWRVVISLQEDDEAGAADALDKLRKNPAIIEELERRNAKGPIVLVKFNFKWPRILQPRPSTMPVSWPRPCPQPAVRMCRNGNLDASVRTENRARKAIGEAVRLYTEKQPHIFPGYKKPAQAHSQIRTVTTGSLELKPTQFAQLDQNQKIYD
jgi:hypothetical protein